MAYKYDVALSFLSRDEALAQQIQAHLQTQLRLSVFLYLEQQRELTGKTPGEAFSPVFEEESRIVVVLYSPGWGQKGGTLVERRAILRRQLRGDERFLYLIVVQRGNEPPPWSDDLIYFDISRFQLRDAITAIQRMVRAHERNHSIFVESTPHAWDGPEKTATGLLRARLLSDFNTSGPYRGHFGGIHSANDAARWQSQGGEVTDSTFIRKLPYYHTYWG